MTHFHNTHLGLLLVEGRALSKKSSNSSRPPVFTPANCAILSKSSVEFNSLSISKLSPPVNVSPSSAWAPLSSSEPRLRSTKFLGSPSPFIEAAWVPSRRLLFSFVLSELSCWSGGGVSVLFLRDISSSRNNPSFPWFEGAGGCKSSILLGECAELTVLLGSVACSGKLRCLCPAEGGMCLDLCRTLASRGVEIEASDSIPRAWASFSRPG